MMSASRKGSRPATGQWGRLRDVSIDPLEDMGLPSKGDHRLLDLETQQTYFGQIVERYMKFCAASGGGPQLERQFSSLSISSNVAGEGRNATQTKLVDSPSSATTPSPTKIGSAIESPEKEKELSKLLLAMRKLREAIVASSRSDSFSIQVYMFCIRAAILVKHVESYHPALLHLLRVLHPACLHVLSRSEFQEMSDYLILDLACRQQNFTAAYATRHTLRRAGPSLSPAKGSTSSSTGGGRVDSVLLALVHDNYHLFWRLQQSVDGYQKRLMEFAEEGMRIVALKCLGKAYFSVDKGLVLKVVSMETWLELQERHRVGWELNGNTVIIRKPKRG